jgi:hypothetical protein
MKTFILVVLSAFVIEGDIVKPGQLVEMTDKEARAMLSRNKVRLATDADLKKAGVYRGIDRREEGKRQEPATPPAGDQATAADKAGE